ncbi:hypothetical protein C6N40_12475 [Arenimonas caeni]|uniref:DUF2752 domain-containing protein n=2 Tax=Arenimonas caeni TaxID=2058085 RepID=A0A2P6M6F0_9GAMM|nr:hypothetical protein C6N40_12475 [Arenimonas caeni]
MHLWWLALLAPTTALGVWMLRTFDPNAEGSPFLGCIFYQVTGLLCPACGSTRAMHALVHLELGRALSMNALLLIGGPIGLLLVLRALGRGPARLEPVLGRISSPWLWVAIVLGYGVVRNLPGFEFLAPLA